MISSLIRTFLLAVLCLQAYSQDLSFPTAPLTPEQAGRVQEAIDLIKCHEGGTGQHHGSAVLQEMLDQGRIKSMVAQRGEVMTNLTEGAMKNDTIYINPTHLNSLRLGAPNLARVLRHEGEHKQNSDGFDVDGDGNPDGDVDDQIDDPTVDDTPQGIRNHAFMLMRDARLLCELGCSACPNSVVLCSNYRYVQEKARTLIENYGTDDDLMGPAYHYFFPEDGDNITGLQDACCCE